MRLTLPRPRSAAPTSIRRLRNITLIGYAQYAYQNGGGNISPLPGAPQKFIAANDYRRIYDLEHGRMLHQERRNDLFPFANYGGHDFALQRQGLDGDVAYNINAQGQAARGGDARDRRMWMHTNPVGRGPGGARSRQCV